MSAQHATKWSVHEGRPSWHQQRAGHISAGVTLCDTKAEAEAYLASFKKHHPDEQAFILPPARTAP